MANVIIGVVLMLISTTMMNIGSVIQKHAVDQLPAMETQKASDNVKGVVTSKIWVFGWILTTGAMVFNWLALGYADITLIQPLIAFGLIVLVIFSHFYIGENVTKREGLGIAIAIVGVIMLGLTAEFSEPITIVDEIFNQYLTLATLGTLVVFYVVIVVLWVRCVKQGYKGAGISFSTIAAMFSVLGLTFSKGASEALSLLGFGEAVSIWWVWVLLAIFMAHSTMAIICQQISFQKGKAVVVTPNFNLLSIILPIVTGYFVFSEPISLLKIISMSIIAVGAFLLSYKHEEVLEEIIEESLEKEPITEDELEETE